MARFLKIAAERIPTHLFESSEDWSDLFFSQLVATPLYSEWKDRTVRSDLIANCSRYDDCAWRLTIDRADSVNKAAIWDASAVCSQIVLANKRGVLSSALISKLRTVGRSVIEVQTTIPIADIRRVLSSPHYALHQGLENYCNNSGVGTFSRDRLTLRSPEKELKIKIYSRESAEYLDVDLDLEGPMAFEPSEWIAIRKEGSSHEFPLDFFYAIIAPYSLPVDEYHTLRLGIDRHAIVNHAAGLLEPANSLVSSWMQFEHDACGDRMVQRSNDHTPLHYADFPLNKLVADQVAAQAARLGFNFQPKKIEYEELVRGRYRATNDHFKLVILHNPWPHPAAIFTPFYVPNFVCERFKQLYEASLSSDKLEEAAVFARASEEALSSNTALPIPIAQVVGAFKTKTPNFYCPPSGFILSEAFE